MGGTVLQALGSKARALGLQRVIYWDRLYDESSPGGEPYHGSSPHHDHLHIEQTRGSAESLSYAAAWDLLDGGTAAPLHEGSDSMVILGYGDVPGDTARWLLAGGKRVYLHQWSNVQALIDAGFPTILLPREQVAQIPEIR